LMVYVGLISYPLYLWHWPILSFLRIMEGQEILQYKRAIAVVAAFILAWLTYQFVEKPIRQAPRSRTMVIILLALLTSVGLFGLSAYLSEGFKQRGGSLPSVVNAGDIGEYRFYTYIKKNSFPCTPDSIYKSAGNWNGIVQCYQSKPYEAKDMAIIGDSHAEHLYLGLYEALPGRNVVFYPTDGMPFITDKKLAAAFDYVLNQSSIKSVIISAIWHRKVADPANQEWKLDLLATATKLTEAGKNVYITDDVPQFSFIPSRCKFEGRVGIENKCIEADTLQNVKFSPVFDEIAQNNPRFHVIRTYGQFCRDGICKMGDEGVLYFRDEHHLNIPGSRKVGLEIARQMNDIENNGGK
jgi:SGNH domain (fused to AT3 domains)